MHRTDPATCEPAHAVAVLILNIARHVHRAWLRGPHPWSQPALNSSSTSRHLGLSSLTPSFAPRQFLVSTRLHSKCPPRLRVQSCFAVNLCYVVRTFRAFRLLTEPQTRLYWD